MPPTIITPRRVKYYKPMVYAEIPGTYLKRAGRSLAGRRIGVILPQNPGEFHPDEHIQDLGPLADEPGTRQRPLLIVPGAGTMDMQEIRDVVARQRERNAQKVRDGLRRSQTVASYSQRFHDHIDQLLRAHRGHRTFGPINLLQSLPTTGGVSA